MEQELGLIQINYVHTDTSASVRQKYNISRFPASGKCCIFAA